MDVLNTSTKKQSDANNIPMDMSKIKLLIWNNKPESFFEVYVAHRIQQLIPKLKIEAWISLTNQIKFEKKCILCARHHQLLSTY